MADITTIIAAILSSGVISAIVNWLLEKRRRAAEDRKAEAEADKSKADADKSKTEANGARLDYTKELDEFLTGKIENLTKRIAELEAQSIASAVRVVGLETQLERANRRIAALENDNARLRLENEKLSSAAKGC